MIDSKKHFKQGMLWLGLANGLARIFNLVSSLIYLLYLTRQEVGVATLAWSIAVLLEALSGLGIDTALLRAPKVEEKQWHAAFSYVMTLAFILWGLISLASPWIAVLYHAPELQWMIVFSASKLLFVGAALVPLQRLNRKLKFKTIGKVQTLASLGSSLSTIVLVLIGWGAWALVIGNMLYGPTLWAALLFYSPFKPQWTFKWSCLFPNMRIGLKVATSRMIYHGYRNADYLILGIFFGKEAVGIYRAAFNIAMMPAMTLLAVANRTALPIFSKQVKDPKALSHSFLWIQQQLMLWVLPIAVFLSLGAKDLLYWIGRETWYGAAPLIVILAWAAVLRTLAQVFAQIYHAMGRSELAIYDALISAVILIIAFGTSLYFWGQQWGVVVMAYAWLFAYPLLIEILRIFAQQLIPLQRWTYLKNFRDPLILALILMPLGMLSQRWVISTLPWPWLRVLTLAAIVLIALALFAKFYLRLSFKHFFKPSLDKKWS